MRIETFLLLLLVHTTWLVTSCFPPAMEFSNRPCPCGEGWRCDDAEGICIDGGFDLHDADIDSDGQDSESIEDGDSPADGPTIPCDWRGEMELGDVEEMVSLNSTAVEGDLSLSPDGRTLYFSSNRGGGPGGGDIFFATRESLDFDAVFEPPELMPSLNSESDEGRLTITDNALQVFFDSDREGGAGGTDLWKAERRYYTHYFDAPQLVTLSTVGDDREPFLSPDGRSLFWASRAEDGNQDILVATRDSLLMDFSNEQPIPAVDTAYNESAPSVTQDGIVLTYGSDSIDGRGGGDIWYSTLENGEYSQGRQVLNFEVNTPRYEGETAIRFDGCELFFVSNRGGTGSSDIYRARFIRPSQ